MKKRKHQSATDKMMGAVYRRAIALNRIDLLQRADISVDMPLYGRDSLLRGLEYDVDQLYEAQQAQYTKQIARTRGLNEDKIQRAKSDHARYVQAAEKLIANNRHLRRAKLYQLAQLVKKDLKTKASVKTITRALQAAQKISPSKK